ncbi:hypothetical protein HYT24_01225 [Candidatus Pacearchaeota archaeon]|nr:hypothetical protein [Candidatus Pacearchaeota archaeon]
MDTKELQKIEKEFDEQNWDHKDLPVSEQIRHITLHMGKLLGKLSTYSERMEHNINFSDEQIRNEVTPDLLMHALRLSNLLGEDLEELYKNRLVNVKETLDKEYKK